MQVSVRARAQQVSASTAPAATQQEEEFITVSAVTPRKQSGPMLTAASYLRLRLTLNCQRPAAD